MKTTININQKIGQPNYGSFGASCSFEIDIDQSMIEKDPQLVLAQCRLLADMARAAVNAELDTQRKQGGRAAAVADLVDERDDTRPGDPAYDRSHGGPRTREDFRQSDRRTEDQRRDDREERSREYRQNYEDTLPREERRSERRSEGRSNGSSGPPKNGRQFLGWLGKQDPDVQARAKRIAKAWNLPGLMKDWSDDEALDMHHELTAKVEPAGRRNSNGNGYHSDGRNGSAY